MARWPKKTIPTIFLERKTAQAIIKNFHRFKKFFKIELLKPNRAIDIFGTRIIPFRVSHDFRKNFPALGFKIGKNLIYASDFKKIPAPGLEYLKNVKIVILDGAMYFKKQIFSHQNTGEAIELAKKLKIKNLYLTQIGHTYPPHAEAEREIKKFWQKIKAGSKMKIFLAYDGLKIKA